MKIKFINLLSIFRFIAIIIDQSFAESVVYDINNQVVQYKQFKLREYAKIETLEYIFDFSYYFTNKPKIIFGITFYNNQDEPNPDGIDFHITGENIGLQNCIVKLHLNDPQYLLYGLSVIALAIDNQYLTNIKVSDLKAYKTDNFQIKNGIYTHEIIERYSPEIMNYKGKKNVAVFLNGFKTKQYKNEQYMKIALEVELRESDFLIKVISKQGSIQFETVYIQYIETVDDIESNFFAEIFVDNKFKDQSGCLKKSVCPKQSEIINYKLNTNVLTNNGNQRFLYGINQLDFSFGQHQKIELSSKQFKDQDLQMEYLIDSSDSIINGIQSTSIIIGIKKCKNYSYYKNQCIPQCNTAGRKIKFYEVDYCGCGYDEYFSKQDSVCKSITDKTKCQMLYFPYNTCCLSDSDCPQCSNTEVLQDNICQATCKPGFYNKNNICTPCPRDCIEFQDGNSCNRCKTGYYRIK